MASFREIVENNIAIWFFSTLATGFAMGYGTHKALSDVSNSSTSQPAPIQTSTGVSNNHKDITMTDLGGVSVADLVDGLIEIENGKTKYFKLPDGSTEGISISMIRQDHGYARIGLQGETPQLYIGESIDCCKSNNFTCKVTLPEINKGFQTAKFRVVCSSTSDS